jgi:hypothetical protein
LSLAFNVRRSCLQTDDVVLLQLEFGGIFNGDDPVRVGDKAGESVKSSRLTGTSTARNDDIQSSLHSGLQASSPFSGVKAL